MVDDTTSLDQNSLKKYFYFVSW